MTALFIVKREQGDYAVRIPGSERASVVRPLRDECVSWARDKHPYAKIYIERVRDTSAGGRDKWRLVA